MDKNHEIYVKLSTNEAKYLWHRILCPDNNSFDDYVRKTTITGISIYELKNLCSKTLGKIDDAMSNLDTSLYHFNDETIKIETNVYKKCRRIYIGGKNG
jgi:hypothetical protein